jgi:hypothetical protein
VKVKELIELLKKEDQELDIWLSRDSEGNAYSKLSNDEDSLEIAYIENEAKCIAYEIFDDEWYEDYTEEELNEFKKDMKKVLVLFPI